MRSGGRLLVFGFLTSVVCCLAIVSMSDKIKGMSVAINSSSPIMTVAEAAKYLGLSPHSVRKYIQREIIKPVATVGRVHLVTKDECDRYAAEKNPRGNPNFVKRRRKAAAKSV